jgi:hypothetical protein
MKEAKKRKDELDDLTYSGIAAEFLVSKALRGEIDDETLKLLEDLNPKHRRITLAVLNVLGVDVRNVLSLLKEFEVEVAYLRFRDLLVDLLVKLMDLSPEFAKEMDIEFAMLKGGERLEKNEVFKSGI